MSARSAARVLIWLVCLLVGTSVHAQEPTCSNGVPGVQSEAFEDICCAAGCLVCGGPQCISGNRRVGLGARDCCNGTIRNNGDDCATTGEGPCVIVPPVVGPTTAPSPGPTPAPTPTPEPTCSNGVPGVQSEAFEDICCAAGCLVCGGPQCISGNRRVGLGARDCCNGTIRNNGDDCATTGEGPCVIVPPVVAAENECLDLTNDANRCSVDEFGSMFLASCDITDQDVEAGDLAACFDAAGPQLILELRIGANDMTTLPPTIFNSLVNLERLIMSGTLETGLESLPAGIFDPLTELTLLRLALNELTTLPPNIFDSLTKLEILDLDFNGLTALPAGIFDSLTELTFLIIGRNDLAILPPTVFDSLTKLEFLQIGRNDLATLPPTIFDSLTKLKILDLDSNGLTALPVGIFDSLTELTFLNIGRNELTTLPPTVFDSLTKLEILNIERNDLATLPPTIFDSLTNLDRLIMSDNERLTTLPPNIFDPLTNLSELDLPFNDLVTLPSGIFDSLTELEGLDLRGNDLETLPAEIFDSLTELTSLDMSLNDNERLTTLPPTIFDSLTKLGVLGLRDSGLVTLPSGIFDSLTELQTLSLAFNDLVTLPSGIFESDSLTELRNLNLLGNPDLECVPTVLPTITGLRFDSTVGTECGCVLPDGSNPCGENVVCSPGATGFTCG